MPRILLVFLCCGAHLLHVGNGDCILYTPKPLNPDLACDPSVQRQGIPFVPRCYRAEYFYSLLWTVVGKEPGCEQEIGPVTDLSVYLGLASNVGLEGGVFVKKSQWWTGRFDRSEIVPTPDGRSSKNVSHFKFSVLDEQRDLQWFTVRYMADRSPVPDQCAGIAMGYGIGGRTFLPDFALYIPIPSCEDPPNNSSIPSIEQHYFIGKSRLSDKCTLDLQTSLILTTPVIETAQGSITEKTRLCLPPPGGRDALRIAHDKTCTLEVGANIAFERILHNENRINWLKVGFHNSPENLAEMEKDRRPPSGHRRPPTEPPAGPNNFRCRASEYWYGVVSAEFLCPDPCREPGTLAKCSQSTLSALCGDKACEPSVLVNLASNPRDISVPWHLTNSGDDVTWTYYQSFDHRQQYVYQVTEEDLRDERQCATLLVRIKDRNEEIQDADELLENQPRYGPITDYAFTTFLPLPYWNKLDASGRPQGMSRFISFAQTYDTHLKCKGQQSVRVKVNFMVAFVNITDRFGRMSCVSNENYRCEGSCYVKNVWHWDAKRQAKKLVPPPKDISEVRIGNHRARTQAAAKYLEHKKNKLTQKQLIPLTDLEKIRFGLWN